MSPFPERQCRLIGVLTLKTGQKVFAKKRQQPLWEQNDAKCQE